MLSLREDNRQLFYNHFLLFTCDKKEQLYTAWLSALTNKPSKYYAKKKDLIVCP